MTRDSRASAAMVTSASTGAVLEAPAPAPRAAAAPPPPPVRLPARRSGRADDVVRATEAMVLAAPGSPPLALMRATSAFAGGSL